MSQGKNPDLESFQNSQKVARNSLKKVRNFSIMTYLKESQLSKVMKAHIKSVRAYAYIYHDKDDAEPHIHLIMRTYSSWSCTQLAKWFEGYKDKKGERVNTFVEVAHDLVALKDYMTHSDEESKEKGKHQYNESEIHDFGMWDMIPRNDSYDSSYEILNKVMSGYSYRQLVREYGREFLYHWEKYADVAAEIRQAEGVNKNRMISFMELTDHVEKAVMRENGEKE
jgi:hypothetical protein